MAELFRRHMMVDPSPAAWSALMAERSDLAAEPLVAKWVQAGNPLVVRRPACGDAAGAIPLGLPLPQTYGKRRISVVLPPDGIAHASPPPLLQQAAGVAPVRWRDSIDRLLELDPFTRTFGSLAWQHLTGLPYLAEGSDLDLLWQPRAGTNLDGLLAGISAIACEAPMRIDGEFVGTAGGVQWRELYGDSGQVLVKGQRSICLMDRGAFLAGRAG